MIDPPPARDDSIALPRGVEWMPVDQALGLLKKRIVVTTSVERCELANSCGRFLAEDIIAPNNSPPYTNSAVDGFGICAQEFDKQAIFSLPLHKERVAAGRPLNSRVLKEEAVRILTGAQLPDGVDTVILEEDVSLKGQNIVFRGPIKKGSNTRVEGEDVKKAQLILETGRKLRPCDLALLASVGVRMVAVRKKLRVGILSSGDELCSTSEKFTQGKIFDANKPMLISQMEEWGYDPIDFGRALDIEEDVIERLDQASKICDVLLTTGGASAGDQDYLSATLKRNDCLEIWRLAVKPGRPMAMGFWNSLPIFVLPGNPVAALVCTLIFACPALRVIAGGRWESPKGFSMPAAFAKSKKPGRREFLRGRIKEGRVEAFGSEGSGRVSGLSWAEGLIELGEDCEGVSFEELVRFIPFTSFRE